MRRLASVLVSAMFIALGCGGRSGNHAPRPRTAASAVPVGPPFVAPGERMSYRVTAHDVTLAAFTVVAGGRTTVGDREAIVVQAGAESAGLVALVTDVKAEFTSWIDVRTGEALAFRVDETVGNGDASIERDETQFTAVERGTFPITSHIGGKEVVERQAFTTRPSDFLVFLLMLRAWDAPAGDHRTVDVVRGRYMWRTEVTLARRSALVTELGQLPAVEFEAVASRLMRDGSPDRGTPSRRFTVWISDDADRVPLLLSAQSVYGDIRLDIIDYAAGTAPNLAAPQGR